MIEIGVNSYISVDDANNIVKSNFMSIHPYRKFWDTLSDDDKESIIVATTAKYDTDDMFYAGIKESFDQHLQFPRKLNDIQFKCPDSIKTGLVLQALEDCKTLFSQEDNLKELGVKSFADGSGAKIEFNDEDATTAPCGLTPSLYVRYFKQWTIFNENIGELLININSDTVTIAQLEDQIRELNKQIDSLNNTIDSKDDTITGLNNTIQYNNEQLNDIYNAIVKRGETPTKDDITSYAPAISTIHDKDVTITNCGTLCYHRDNNYYDLVRPYIDFDNANNFNHMFYYMDILRKDYVIDLKLDYTTIYKNNLFGDTDYYYLGHICSYVNYNNKVPYGTINIDIGDIIDFNDVKINMFLYMFSYSYIDKIKVAREVKIRRHLSNYSYFLSGYSAQYIYVPNTFTANKINLVDLSNVTFQYPSISDTLTSGPVIIDIRNQSYYLKVTNNIEEFICPNFDDSVSIIDNRYSNEYFLGGIKIIRNFNANLYRSTYVGDSTLVELYTVTPLFPEQSSSRTLDLSLTKLFNIDAFIEQLLPNEQSCTHIIKLNSLVYNSMSDDTIALAAEKNYTLST